jgi:hypothetical protein
VSTMPPTPTPVIMREWFGVSHLRMITGGVWGVSHLRMITGGVWGVGLSVAVAVAGP